jgi:hypothetical protein
LHDFLTEFVQSRDRPWSYLWVDAICIDRDNIHERNVQVAIMPDIYHSADRVIVWLGKGTEDSDMSMNLITRISAVKDKLRDGSGYKTRLSDKDLAELDLPRSWSLEYRTYYTILLRAWFERAWVIQEVVVARSVKVMCGRRTVPWDDFALALEIVVNIPGGIVIARLNACIGRLSTINALRTLYMSSQKAGLKIFLDVLLKCRFFLSSDLRDKDFCPLWASEQHDAQHKAYFPPGLHAKYQRNTHKISY